MEHRAPGVMVLVLGALAACGSNPGTGSPAVTAAGGTGGAATSAPSPTGRGAGSAAPSSSTAAAGRAGVPAAAAGSSGGSAALPAADSGNAGRAAPVAGSGDAGHVAAGSGTAGRDATAAGSGAAPLRKKFVGNITTRGQVRPDFSMYWNQITPENEGKWGSVEATRNQMNWAGLDRVHDYAKAHGLVFKQHTLVWGSQQPSWLSGLSDADQRAEVEEWIKLFCERYPDVALIDVVNEPPPHTMPPYMNALGGAGSSGFDWIVQAFKWAKQYCPKATLLMNDYNNIEYDGDNQHFLDIVSRIQKAGAPIDALGAQAHDAYKLPANTVQGFLQKLEATGLPVYITEYDLNLADDDEQKMVMQAQFPVFWNDDKVAGITLWGYVTGATWKPNTGLMSDSGTARPALTWLMDFIQ